MGISVLSPTLMCGSIDGSSSELEDSDASLVGASVA
jgi:hypothetical protein